MFLHANDFIFLITGVKDNESYAARYAEECGYKDGQCITFRLEYVPPYEKKFNGIRDFELLSRYHPFHDPIRKERIAVIDLSEWITHEDEYYLDIFLKFLHDYLWSFYEYRYIFTVGDAYLEQVKDLYKKAIFYLNNDAMIINHTLTNVDEMNEYLKKRYKVDKGLADQLSHVFVNHIDGYTQLDMIMDNLFEKLESKRLTKKAFDQKIDIVFESKAGKLFGKELIKINDKEMNINV